MSVCPFLDFLPLLSLPLGEWLHSLDGSRLIPLRWHHIPSVLPLRPNPALPGASEEILVEKHWNWTRLFHHKPHSFDINPTSVQRTLGARRGHPYYFKARCLVGEVSLHPHYPPWLTFPWSHWSSLGSSAGHLCGDHRQHVDGASPLPRGLLRDC